MRLPAVARGKSLSQRIKFRLITAIVGRVPGPILTMSHRPQFFGVSMAPCFQESMREAKEWTVAECEMFSAFVSKLNRCEY